MAGCTLIFSALLTACILQQLCATQVSCRGRCGELFSRGKACSCDDGCLTHIECCDDYEDVCIPMSCRGRCGELFSCGKACSCDDGCLTRNDCCSDYETACSPMSCRGRCGELFSGGKACSCDDECLTHNDCCNDYETVCSPMSCQGRCGHFFSRGKACTCDDECGTHNECCNDYEDVCTSNMTYNTPESWNSKWTPDFPYGGIKSALPRARRSSGAKVDGGSVVKFVPPTKDPAASPPADADLYLPLPPENPTEITAGTSHAGISSPGESVADKALEASSTVGQPSQSSSPDVCNGLPIRGVASFNGFIIVFKGHFFWLLDPKTREAGPARSITADLGIPSPIDTAFTRCNCESETHIIKGDNYWSFQNGVMERGYPRSVSKDFAGLSGNIVAALSVPATRNMPEAVFFFKKGGTVQKLTYPAGSWPTCTGKTGKNPMPAENRQPGSLSGEINISLMWKGFPTPVTSALSMSNTEMPDGFEHYIFSGPNVLSIEISGDVPVLAIPAKPPAENDVKKWLNCPL